MSSRIRVTPGWLVPSCAWWRYLVWSLYGTTNLGEWLLSLIIRTEVPGHRKNWFKWVFLKYCSVVIRIYIYFIERVGWFEGTNDLREGVVLYLLGCDTKVVEKSSQWGWWRLSGIRRMRSWFACGSGCSVVYEFWR